MVRSTGGMGVDVSLRLIPRRRRTRGAPCHDTDMDVSSLRRTAVDSFTRQGHCNHGIEGCQTVPSSADCGHSAAHAG